MRKNKLLILLLSTLAINAFAVQEFSVAPNGQIDAVISDNDVSRIAIVGEKIQSIKLASNQLKINKDDTNGQIFVIPIKQNSPVVVSSNIGGIATKSFSGSTINLFLVGENGDTYSLRLRMSSVPSETILIKPTGSSANVSASTDFTNQIATMIEDMYLNHGNSDGYSVVELNTSIKLWKDVNFSLYKTYENDIFKGSVYILRNSDDKQIRLAENQFWKPNTVAISIERPVLNSGELTKVFILEAKKDEE